MVVSFKNNEITENGRYIYGLWMEVIPEDLVYTKVLYLQWTKGCCVYNASDGPLTTKNIN